MTGFASEARQQARETFHKASPFVEKYARFGYAAKGVVYCMVGILAALAAFNMGGQTTGSRGALQSLMNQPFGQILLAVVAFGLSGYSLWQFIRAVEDPENEGSDAKGIAKRVFYFISGIIHLTLVVAAVQMLLGNGGQGDEDAGTRGWTATVMSYPFGQWLVGILGVVVTGFGLQQVYKGYRADLDDMLVLGELSPSTRRWVRYVSRFGMAARGVVFAIVGVFFVVAAYQHDPNEARGLAGALRTVERQAYGPWLLGLVALGLIAYGVYEFVKARYRRIETGES